MRLIETYFPGSDMEAKKGKYKGWDVKIVHNLALSCWFFYVWKENETYNSLWDKNLYRNEEYCVKAAEEWIRNKHR